MARIAWIENRTLTWILAGAIIAGVAARLVLTNPFRPKPVVLVGAVIRKDTDPRKESPIADARITVLNGTSDGYAKSDASGLFKLKAYPWLRNRPVTLRFEHAAYQTIEIPVGLKDQLYVVRMEPLVRKAATEPDHTEAAAKAVHIANVRVRYSVKDQTLVNVGSLAKQFEVPNAGNVPCKGKRPCSPDGKWKASTVTIPLDAQKGNEFRNVRASCIAGPCPFTRVEPDDLSRPARKIQITALDWSDSASFLVEAEVTRTMTTDQVRQSYPFVTGQTMSFALPAAAEGPSLIADVNGQEIVFPLGPDLILSWTTCSVDVAQGGNKLYRCEIKPGYRIQ